MISSNAAGANGSAPTPSADHPAAIVIFDFDGTIADSLEAGVLIFNELASDFGLPRVTPEQIPVLRKMGSRQMLKSIEISHFQLMRLAGRMRKRFAAHMGKVELVPGIKEVLRSLKSDGHTLGILSSNSRKNIEAVLARYGMRDCFTFVEAGASFLGKAKRLEKIVSRKRLGKANVVYVGDETRDLDAAREAGLKSAGVGWGATEYESLAEENPDFMLKTPSDLLAAARAIAASPGDATAPVMS